MKVDGLGVVLAIILLPIILITTYYIQMQVDTIATENQYNTKLLDATYDAMSAFEINTANEELSSVADSMRSIVLASNNIFLNTLATNFGLSNASKELIQPYIPAVLYTMYDGYYIYAPTETAKVAEKIKEKKPGDSEELITTQGYLSVGDPGTEGLGGTYGDIVYEKADGSYTLNKDEAKEDRDYILKSYVQYSARYKKNGTSKVDIDVTINYTLDNYLNIVGTIGDIYYTKTGYLIKDGLVTEAKIGTDNLLDDNEKDVENKILGYDTNVQATTIPAADSANVIVNGVTIESNFANNIREKIYAATRNTVTVSTISQAETYLEKFYEEYDKNPSANAALLTDIQDIEYEIQKCKAVAYYASSACFSNWVYENLSELTYENIQDGAMTGYYVDEDGNPIYNTTYGATGDLYYDFHNDAVKGTSIFNDTAHPDPEDTESNFNTHKMEVIKNSIKYNLNLSISAYSKMEHPYDCSLPVLLDEEWDKILSNISIVSFMQGWDCGLDIYNNYQIVSSTNNELTVTPSEIYYVQKSEFNDANGSYHRIDCPKLAEATEYISFKSKEVKYDKIYDKAAGKYMYDHKNLACYTCINTNNYSDSTFSDSSATSYYDRMYSLNNDNKKIAGYIGLAKERQDIYKTNALPVSEGYKIIYNNDTGLSVATTPRITSRGLESENVIKNKRAKKLQITVFDVASTNREPILNLNIQTQDQDIGTVALSTGQKKEYTFELDVSSIDDVKSINFQIVSPTLGGQCKIKSIKAIYK